MSVHELARWRAGMVLRGAARRRINDKTNGSLPTWAPWLDFHAPQRLPLECLSGRWTCRSNELAGQGVGDRSPNAG